MCIGYVVHLTNAGHEDGQARHRSYFSFFTGTQAHDSARRLFDDLLTHYNRLVRPVRNHSQTLQVRLNLKLSQLLDVVSIAPFRPCCYN